MARRPGRLPGTPGRVWGAPWVFPTALSLIVGAAGVHRLSGLDRLGLSSDEAVYVGQGLGLAGSSNWSTVRAHPPLLGLVLDAIPGGTSGEAGPRAVSVVLGLLAVVVAGLLARELAGRGAGLLAAVAVAAMPYHSDVTRQALVEVPMATAAAFALFLVARAARTGREGLVEVAAVVLGVATLAKETALLTVAAVVLALVHGDPRVGRRTLVRSAGWYLAVVALYPAYLWGRGSLDTGVDYLGWQLGRTGGPTVGFYATEVLPRMGPVLVVMAVVGAVLVLREGRTGGAAVVLAAVVPLAFYAVWPVGGYPYLLGVVVPLAALAASGAVSAVRVVARRRRGVAWAALAAVAVAGGIGPASAAAPLLPGASGVPAVREAARWTSSAHPDLPVVTAAPWVANVVRYYRRSGRVLAMAPTTIDVSRLNPAYRSTVATELPGGPSVVVWDRWSAATDPAGSDQLLAQVRARGGRVAHVETDVGTMPRVLVVCFVVGAE